MPLVRRTQYQLAPVRQRQPARKYPTASLDVGGGFSLPIEDELGQYDWPEHNRIRSSVYKFMRQSVGKGRKFTVEQRLIEGRLMVTVTRVQ
jgi:hypothetical protein